MGEHVRYRADDVRQATSTLEPKYCVAVPTPAEITHHHEWTPPDEAAIFVDGGPDPEPVEIVAYDPAWPAEYALVAERIHHVLDTRVVGLDHVGSTSVPGLPAKPVIDIDLTVIDSSHEAAYVPVLQSAGFRLVIRESGWHEHRLLTLDTPRVNLHVFSPDCPEVIRHRMFRDWLIEHPDDRSRYLEAKLEAAAGVRATDDNVMAYNQRKQPVIRDIYARMFRAHGLL